jgi:putative SOS response-associated peptidase YedK
MTDCVMGHAPSKRTIFEAATRRADKLRTKGKPIDFDQLLRMEPDRGTTNVRNTGSQHRKPRLSPANRCLVLSSSFSEPSISSETGKSEPYWFAVSEECPPSFFVGVWLPSWSSVRKVKTGMETIDVFAFRTCDPDSQVRTIHPQAMPVILISSEELEVRWHALERCEASSVASFSWFLGGRGPRRLTDPSELTATPNQGTQL